jgi:hypothetical protein
VPRNIALENTVICLIIPSVDDEGRALCNCQHNLSHQLILIQFGTSTDHTSFSPNFSFQKTLKKLSFFTSRRVVTKFLSFENSEKTERCLSSRFVLKGCLSGAKNAPLQSKLFRF